MSDVAITVPTARAIEIREIVHCSEKVLEGLFSSGPASFVDVYERWHGNTREVLVAAIHMLAAEGLVSIVAGTPWTLPAVGLSTSGEWHMRERERLRAQDARRKEPDIK